LGLLRKWLVRGYFDAFRARRLKRFRPKVREKSANKFCFRLDLSRPFSVSFSSQRTQTFGKSTVSILRRVLVALDYNG